MALYLSVLYLVLFHESQPPIPENVIRASMRTTVIHNGSFSARLNVSQWRNVSFHSLPCPYCDTVVLQRSLLLKNKVKKISIKGGVFCVVCKRVSLQVSTWNTKVFSYLICIHSHNEWTCLSCFQVRRVQTRLLFPLSLDTWMLLPPVQALERSHKLCPGWIFSSSLLNCLCSRKPFQINV